MLDIFYHKKARHKLRVESTSLNKKTAPRHCRSGL